MQWFFADYKMKKLGFVTLALTLTTNIALARSGGVGNGGDAVVCPNSVTLLDSYESKKLGLTLNLDIDGVETSTRRTMVSKAVKRLTLKDKYTAKKLYEYSMEMVSDFEQLDLFYSDAESFKGKVLYIGPDVVGEINDSEHRTLPAGCEIRQLVSQIKPERLLENRYEFNKLLWDKLSKLDQAMTILHEAWYRIMLEDGAKDSKGARYMNALIASSEFESYNFADYIKELSTTEKKSYVVENNSTLVFDKEFKVDLKKSQLDYQNTRVCTPSLDVKANIKKVAPIFNVHLGLAKTKFEDVCFNNSVIESLTLPKKFSGKRINFVMENYLVRTNGNTGSAGVIKFNTNGTFKEVQNLEYEALYKMFYVCGRGRNKVETFQKKPGCKGPYLLDDSKVSKPQEVIFDMNEIPIGYNFPTEL